MADHQARVELIKKDLVAEGDRARVELGRCNDSLKAERANREREFEVLREDGEAMRNITQNLTLWLERHDLWLRDVMFFIEENQQHTTAERGNYSKDALAAIQGVWAKLEGLSEMEKMLVEAKNELKQEIFAAARNSTEAVDKLEAKMANVSSTAIEASRNSIAAVDKLEAKIANTSSTADDLALEKKIDALITVGFERLERRFNATVFGILTELKEASVSVAKIAVSDAKSDVTLESEVVGNPELNLETSDSERDIKLDKRVFDFFQLSSMVQWGFFLLLVLLIGVVLIMFACHQISRNPQESCCWRACGTAPPPS